MSTSIKKKLLLISLLTTGVALLLASLVFVTNETILYRRALVNTLTMQAQIIGNNSTVALAFNNRKDAETVLGALSCAPNILRAAVFTRDRTLFASYQRAGVAGLPVYHEGADDGHQFELNRLTIVKPITLDGETIGRITIESDLQEFYLRMAWHAGVALIAFASALALAYLLHAKLQQVISDPILELAEITRTVSKDKDYSVRSVVRSGDEIGVLSEGLNEMLSQIQKRDQELEQHQRHLEELVALRTNELTQVNNLLQKKLEEQKKAEVQLQRYAADLKLSNADVLSFAYIVSHDLRAPLVSIKGFTGELQMAMKKIEAALVTGMLHLDERERPLIEEVIRRDVPEAMKFIGSSVSRMDGLINAILTLSREGHRELNRELIDIEKLTHSIISSLAHQLEQHKTSISVENLPVITADKLSMEQIMGNLLDNALKYLEQGREGTITITAEQSPQETTFHVRDNGRGIAQDDLEKIFEIFRRAGKQDIPGEGMGLSYVKVLVCRHGGRIWCDSELGKGSTFSFSVTNTPIEQKEAV